MSNCPYFDNCFRRSYTQFLQDNNDQYPDYLVDRNELFFQGYSSQDMMNARRSKKGKLIYKGLYCQTLQDPVNIILVWMLYLRDPVVTVLYELFLLTFVRVNICSCWYLLLVVIAIF